MKLRKFAWSAIALLSLGALVTGNSYAQDANQPPNRDNRAGRAQGNRQAGGRQSMAQTVAAAFKAVSPTADQEAKFKALQESYQKDMAALRDVAREERREKNQAVNAKFRTETIALLTEEQKPKFEEELRKAQQRRGGLMNALEPLKLTDDQKKSIQPIVQETQRQMMEAMRNQEATPQERMTTVNGLVDAFKGKVRPLLTETQQKDFDALDFRRSIAGGRGGQGTRQRRPGAQQPPPPIR